VRKFFMLAPSLLEGFARALLSIHTNCSRADRTCKTRPPRKAAATRELFHESPVTDHQSLFTGRRPLVARLFFPYTLPHEVNPK